MPATSAKDVVADLDYYLPTMTTGNLSSLLDTLRVPR